MKTRTQHIFSILLLIFFLGALNLNGQKFWISNVAGAWGNAANWSNTPGGAGGAGVPLPFETAVFDNYGIGNCTIVASTTITGITVNVGYTGVITQGVNNLTVTSATFSGGTFMGGSGSISANNLTISGTNFTSTSGTLSVCNSLIFTSGVFNHNFGTVDINPNCSAGYTFAGNFTFYDLKYSVNFTPVTINTVQNVINNFTISSSTGGTGALNLNARIMVNQDLIFTGTSGFSLNGPDTIKVKKNITMSNMNILGNGTVAMIGTTPQTYTGNSARGFGTLPNLHIECNNATFDNIVSFGYGLRYVSGVANFTPTSTTYWNPLAGFVPTASNIWGTMTFNKLYLKASYDNLTINQQITVMDSTIIDLPGALSPLTLNSPLNANGHVMIINTDALVLNGGNFNVRQNFIVNNNSTLAGGGTGTIRFDGTGGQLWDGTTGLGQFQLPNIVIDKPSGLLTIQEFSDVLGNWTQIQGMVDAVSFGSTVQFDNNSAAQNINNFNMQFDNVVVNTFQYTPLTLSSTLSIKHDFTITANGGMSAGNNIIYVGDDWTNNNPLATSFLPGTSTVTFFGNDSNEVQLVKSNNRPFYRVTLLNGGLRSSCDEITLLDIMRITNAFTPTSGRILSTATNLLRLSNGTTTTIGNSVSYVNGPMEYLMAFAGLRTLNFPIGKGNKHRPVVLKPTHSNLTSVTYSGEVMNSSAMALGYTLPATLSHVSYVRYWHMTRQSVSNLTSCTATLYYGPDDVVTDPTNLVVAKNIGVGTNWFDMGGPGSAPVTGFVTSIPFTTFSDFTLGNRIGGTNPLPVELTNFDAEPKSDMVKIKWNTSSEVNNDYFTVERSSDAINYEVLEIVDGAGNSNSPLSYTTWDNNPLRGTSYYRLKQTDMNGSFKYYGPKLVTFASPSEINVQVFPNPFNDEFNISIIGAESEIKMNIIDIAGRMIYCNIIQPDSELHSTKINNEIFPAKGVYILEIIVGEKTYTSKIIYNGN